MFSSILITSTLLTLALATPTLERRQSIPSLSSSQISSFKPYSFYASAGYCNPSTTINWSCGANCQANPSFEPIASGGDGSDVQFWYVGYDPTLRTVIVAHQGTDPSSFEADLTDGDFFLTGFSSSLFPGLSSSIEGHSGFLSEQAITATSILSAVKTGLSTHGANSVTLVGHSLGAALSLIDSVYLHLNLPSSTSIRTIVYGLPRVGNQAFANYVDSNLHLTHNNNMKDPIPIVPGRFLGFVHPAGENHINADSSWSACPGQDNSNVDCIVGDVPNIFDGDLGNHDGPYDGVTMGC